MADVSGDPSYCTTCKKAQPFGCYGGRCRFPNRKAPRVVQCEVRSEAEWRERFESAYKPSQFRDTAYYEFGWRFYIHAKREEGLVSGEQGGGT